MTERRPDPPVLSPGSLDLLESWLSGRLAQDHAPEEPLTASRVVQYLSGSLRAAEARLVERQLVAAPPGRQLLRRVYACLEGLRAAPWARIAAQAEGEGEGAEVAAAWLQVLNGRTAAAAGAQERWLSSTWSEVGRQVADGVIEAQAALAGVLSFGRQWAIGLAVPRVAVARGGEHAGAKVGGTALPAGVCGRLVEALVGRDAGLAVAVQFTDALGRPSQAADSAPAHLALHHDGDDWPLSTTRVVGDHAEWTVPSFGALMRLPAGDLPAGSLSVMVGDTPTWRPAVRRRLLAEVLDARGRRASALPVAIDLLDDPCWERGRLSLTVDIAPATRAACPSHRLTIDMTVDARRCQRLGEWALSEWDDGPRRLAAACPGSVDATVPFLWLLSAALRASGSS